MLTQTIKQNKNNFMKNIFNLKFIMIALIFINLFALNVFADTPAPSASTDIIGDKLCKLVATLQGNIAKTVAIIAIMTIAIGLFTGKTSWPVALTVAVGIIILFSAPGVVKMIAGDSASTDCATTPNP
jgi:type IV secretory pathway VirB2 component (pilin)